MSPSFLQAGQPGLPEIPKPGTLKPSLPRIWEQIGDNSVKLARQRFNALDLVGQQRDQFGRKIDGSPLAILHCPWFEP